MFSVCCGQSSVLESVALLTEGRAANQTTQWQYKYLPFALLLLLYQAMYYCNMLHWTPRHKSSEDICIRNKWSVKWQADIFILFSNANSFAFFAFFCQYISRFSVICRATVLRNAHT